MDIKVSYQNQLVGVYNHENIFLLPLAKKVSNGYIHSILQTLKDGGKVIFQDEDGTFTEFEKVTFYEHQSWNT